MTVDWTYLLASIASSVLSVVLSVSAVRMPPNRARRRVFVFALLNAVAAFVFIVACVRFAP